MGPEWEGNERVKDSTAETAWKRPERPWTAAGTMEVLRRCPLAIAQRLVHCAIAVSTAVLDRVTKTMSIAPLLTRNLDNSKQKTSNLPAQLHLPTHDLFWAKFRVQLHLPPLRSLDLLISPGTLYSADIKSKTATYSGAHVSVYSSPDYIRQNAARNPQIMFTTCTERRRDNLWNQKHMSLIHFYSALLQLLSFFHDASRPQKLYDL